MVEPGMGMSLGWLIASWVFLAFGIWLNVLVLKKAGRSPFWAVLFLFPILWVVGLWAFAFTRWPRVDRLPAPTHQRVPDPDS